MEAEYVPEPASGVTGAKAISPVVIRYGRVGDMVMQEPLLRSLHRRYGLPCILVTTGAWSPAIFRASPHVATTTVLRGRHRPFVLSPDRWKLVAMLRHHEGPIYVSEDIERQLDRIRRLLRYAGVPPERCVFLEDIRSTDEHVVDRLLCLAACTPAAWSPTNYPQPAGKILPIPTLGVRPEDRVACETWLRDSGWAGRPIVLLQPGSKHAIKWGRQRNNAKAWPSERWTELVGLLSSHVQHGVFLLCGSRQERSFLNALRDRSSTAGVTMGVADVPLQRLMSLMCVAHSMVSVDTGPAHLAAALGCPLVVIYGSEPRRLWSRRSIVPDSVMELGGPPDHARADAIATSAVFEAWRSLTHRR